MVLKLFAHRGFVTKSAPENSIASLDAAKERGFIGVEFDIHFIDETLVIKHDPPQLEEVKQLPHINDYFTYHNDLHYWLDFKNMNEHNITPLLHVLKDEIQKAKIDLDNIYFAPGITNYNIAANIFEAIENVFGNKAKLVVFCTKRNQIAKLKTLLKNNSSIRYISILHTLINQQLVNELPHINLMAWTVNDMKRIKELKEMGVNYFATDTITPNTIFIL